VCLPRHDLGRIWNSVLPVVEPQREPDGELRRRESVFRQVVSLLTRNPLHCILLFVKIAIPHEVHPIACKSVRRGDRIGYVRAFSIR
jgi:hypothetical protein